MGVSAPCALFAVLRCSGMRRSSRPRPPHLTAATTTLEDMELRALRVARCGEVRSDAFVSPPDTPPNVPESPQSRAAMRSPPPLLLNATVEAWSPAPVNPTRAPRGWIDEQAVSQLLSRVR